MTGLAIDTMSQWLDTLATTPASGSVADRVQRAKPVAAVDACWTADGAKIEESAQFDGPGCCNEPYPSHGTPRLVAGARLSDDALKCQLKPIDPKDYTAAFTAEELRQLRQTFPGGVCDYMKPGVNQKPIAGTYLRLPLPTPASRSTSVSR